MPRGAPADDLRAVLARCDRDSVGGRRNYAIVLIMTRLALRGGEVARLELADVGWRTGELTIRGKRRAVRRHADGYAVAHGDRG